MSTYIGFLYKEIIEGLRTKKFLIISVGFIFFALADPVLLKLTPEILKSQAKGMDFSKWIDISQKAAILKFTDDLYQIVSLIIVLTLVGIISSEIKNKTFVFPFSVGSKINGIVLSKFTVYSIFIIVLTQISIYINFVYSKLIFEDSNFYFLHVVRIGIFYGVFFVFLVSLIILFSSFLKNSIVSALCVLGIVYIMPILNNFSDIGKYLPGNVLSIAKKYNNSISKTDIISLTIIFVLIIIFNYVAYRNLSDVEL
ncbi:MAG: hypothetical protein ABF289_09530 [Clostridiales bacterium]